MRVFEAFRLLLGFLCTTEFFQEQLRASGQPVRCRTLIRFDKGLLITTKPVGQKIWCGSTTRKFLAVEDGLLFFLECSSGDQTPTTATAALFDAANATDMQWTTIFEEHEMCEVVKSTISTGKNAAALARRLEDIVVPFNGSSCNAEHYIEYLSKGKASSNIQSCPVFRKFTSRTKINSPQFKLSGHNSDYDWPKQGYNALTLTPRRQGSNNSMASRLYSNTSNSKNSWFRLSKRPSRKNSRDRNTTNPQAVGHFSSSGGRGSSGGRSSGSRGGTEEGGEGSRGSGSTGGYYGYGNTGGGRHHDHSSGSKVVPMWSFKVPTLSSGSGIWSKLSG